MGFWIAELAFNIFKETFLKAAIRGLFRTNLFYKNNIYDNQITAKNFSHSSAIAKTVSFIAEMRP
jgi:hypothetical protein